MGYTPIIARDNPDIGLLRLARSAASWFGTLRAWPSRRIEEDRR
jgi:hypothetical protein